MGKLVSLNKNWKFHLGDIPGIENGKPDDLTCYAYRYRHTFRGRAIVYLRKFSADAPTVLYARTENGLSAEIKV